MGRTNGVEIERKADSLRYGMERHNPAGVG